MNSIKKTVEQVLSKLKTKSSISEKGGANPCVWVEEIFSKKELPHLQARNFNKGTLYITVESSAWLYVLNLHKDAFLARARHVVPEIKEIRFFVGELKK
ncbi:MAG: DciA family protein [Candidatus Omnitrophica bacterium]|nr:DciA family protein [Candidatus Omnitrophota bacterium]